MSVLYAQQKRKIINYRMVGDKITGMMERSD